MHGHAILTKNTINVTNQIIISVVNSRLQKLEKKHRDTDIDLHFKRYRDNNIGTSLNKFYIIIFFNGGKHYWGTLIGAYIINEL